MDYLSHTFQMALILGIITTMPSGLPISVVKLVCNRPRSAAGWWFCIRLTLLISGALNLLIAISGVVFWFVAIPGWWTTHIGLDDYTMPVAAALNAIFCAAALWQLHPQSRPTPTR